MQFEHKVKFLYYKNRYNQFINIRAQIHPMVSIIKYLQLITIFLLSIDIVIN